MQQRSGRSETALLVWSIAVVATACTAEEARVTIHTETRRLEVTVELADTEERRRLGLMYRRELADGTGMLFVFPETAEHTFWMRNTFIPLDMLFIDERLRIVGIHAEARPMSDRRITVGRPSRYVLEVPGGWAARNAVGVGARVDLHGIPTP